MRDLIALPVALLAGALGAWLVGRPVAPVGDGGAPPPAPRAAPLHGAVADLNLRQDTLGDLIRVVCRCPDQKFPPAARPQ